MSPYVKTSFVIVFLFIFNLNGKAQVPSTCFEIESVLVDACGTPEGANEMVRFVVGPSNLNVANLNVNWPNNSFKNICQNGSTASKVATLNNSIVGCGLLLEPSGGVLPAGKKVILLTSTDFDVTANSFANLNDTLYVIFQCAGNTAGHFANYSSSGLRTLTISFSSPASCFDMVTYDRSELINSSGVNTAGDGARVDFDWSGNATYNNNGCEAPIEVKSVDINETGFTICPGDTIDLSATVVGNFISTSWNGGNGTYSSISNNNTTYYSNSADNVDFYIYYEGQTTCSDPIKDSVLIQIGGNTSSVSISSSSTELCNGDSILLTANGSGNYVWSTGSVSNTIYVSQAGTYSVTSSSSCGSSSDDIVITDAPTINLNLTASETEICDGNTATLTASGAPNYTWFNGNTGTSETVNTSGNYYVIGYNSCYTDSQSVTISLLTEPVLSISSSDPTHELCAGETIMLTANGSDNYLWNTSDTASTISVSSAGTYTVSSSNNCFTVNESLILTNGVLPVAIITGDTILCQNEITTLTISGGDVFVWSDGGTSNTHSFSTSAQGYAIATNGCGSDTAYYQVADHSVTASFSSNYFYGMETPASVNFNNTSINGLTFNWTFGNGTTSAGINPTSIYTETGEYEVVLTASNIYCSDSYETTLLFESTNTVYVPNVFTPNNDGTNDFFMIKGENITALECKIFNRWGEEINSWEGLDGYWDGTYNNERVPDGTYFYISKVSWNNLETQTLTGHITLLK